MAKVAAKKKSSGKKKTASKKTAPKKKSVKAKRRAGKSSKKVPAAAAGQDGMGSFLLEHSPDGIVAVDRSGTIRYVNSAAEKLLKNKSAKMVGQKFRYPVDTSRSQEVSISESGHRERVAEIRAMESKMGREKIFVISLRDITDRVNMEAQLRALSDVDLLTGLLNRRGFVEAANRQLTLAQRQKWGMTLLFLDLDGLKWINDEFGHLEGDQALIETAAILRKTVRRPDILGRYAGDEFTILAFEGADSSDSSDKIAERLRINLETHNERKRLDRKISFSIGVARYNPTNTPMLDNLIDDADFKMYEEKRNKRPAR
jgi:diguanylate cyclase (GGDEF)-like protein/PAS domain S-box-containing protein